MVNVFEYYDYRKFLRDSYEEMHSKDVKFSYRFIQNKTGIDPGFLVKVFNGQKRLPEKAIPRFIKLLKLDDHQAEYFTNLVFYGRAKSDIQKKNYFEKLLSYKGPGCRVVETDAYEFYSRWYYTAIRELIGIYPFTGNFEELANLLVPQITTSEAKEGIELLERLGLISKDQHGRYNQTDRFITTGEKCKKDATRTFHKETIQLASDALERIPQELRDISTITATLSADGFSKLKNKMTQFRKEIMKIVEEEKNATGVYHLNFQLFPISKTLQD
jgi:uncharacterized protein (TIGR02147 family)